MKKFRLTRRPKPRPFADKFSPEADFFGSRERHQAPKLGHLPIALLGMLGGVALVGGILLLSGLWRVTDVTADEGKLYAASVVEQVADIHQGDKMLGFDGAAVVQRLKAGLPMMDCIKVRKHLNGEITISFEEITEVYYTCHNANYYIVSAEDLEVLGVFSNPKEAKRAEAVYIGLPEATRVRVGEKLSFIVLPYEPDSASKDEVDYELETDEPEVEYAYVFDFVDAVTISPLAARLTGMELSDRYDIQMVLDGRIKVKIGNMDELDRKLKLIEDTLADRQEAGKDDGTLPVLVDVSDPARIIIRSSPNIELPEWAEGLA